jgi:type I restriction enzyme, R subunit
MLADLSVTITGLRDDLRARHPMPTVGSTFPVSASGEIDVEWRAFVTAQRGGELNQIIEEEGLRPDETREFMENAFRQGALQSTGTAITKVLPPVSRFSPSGGHGEKKQRVLAKLSAFLERFLGLDSGGGQA